MSVAIASGPANVLLILTDDQAWNGTSVQFDPNVPGSQSDFYQTPALEELAATGMRFSNAYAAASICSPTRAALLTGRSPAQLGLPDIVRPHGARVVEGYPLTPPTWRRIDTDTITLPHRVKKSNPDYVTGHIGKWHIDPSPAELGYDIGFDPGRASGVGQNDPASVFAKTAAAIDFLDDRVAADEPFFLQLSHFAVHNPIEGQPEVIDKYENLPKGIIHKNTKYAAFTEALDTSMGQLLDHVQQLGLDENTYVIFASDNGARQVDTSSYPLVGQKAILLEGGVRTPMVIRGPGITPNSVSHVPVTTTDLYSTVSDLVGNTTPLPTGVEGASLVPLLENSGQLPESVPYLDRQYAEGGELYFFQPLNLATGPNYRIRPMSAVRDADHKLLRIHGENGNPDQNLLFDLSNNLFESEYASSSLNLAQEMPEKTEELSGKLDRWLEKTDAALAYNVAEPVDLNWRAGKGEEGEGFWRSAENVDQRWRESWEWPTADDGPQTVKTESHLVGIGHHSHRFDGNDRLQRRYFHVSNGRARSSNTRFPTGVADLDRSVTFQFWARFEDLAGEQLLFENGDAERGLSLSVGDADGDNLYDELRLRLRAQDGKYLAVTADIDDHASPISDLVQLTAVYNDDPNDRYASLYINGALGARVEEDPEESGSIFWDGFHDFTHFAAARFGSAGTSAVGGSGGTGDLPFDAGGFRGDLSGFRFLNRALNQDEVQDSYAAQLTPVGYGITDTVGNLALVAERGVSLAAGAMEHDGVFQVIHERSDTLDIDLGVDLLTTGGSTLGYTLGDSPTGGHLPLGTLVESYLLHFDAETLAGELGELNGSVTFASPILGVLLDEAALDGTDTLLGTAGRFDLGDRSILGRMSGMLSISANQRTLDMDLTSLETGLVQLRVITAQVLPGDYDADGDVDLDDGLAWASAFGVVGPSFADGNRDGTVDAADQTFWRDNVGAYWETATLRGDYNRDGQVDGLDFQLWRSEFGVVGVSVADGNNDGAVNAADYTLWRDQFGAHSAAISQSGDYDDDGDVDINDFVVWREEYGRVGISPADGNRDGRVDGADYTLWRDRLFEQTVTHSETSTVPEPSSCFTALLAAVLTCLTWRSTEN